MVVSETGEAVIGTALIAYGVNLIQMGIMLEGAFLILVGIGFYYWHHRKR